MHRKVLLALITTVFLLSFALVGCQGGIAPELFDQVNAQLKEAQAKVTEAQGKLKDLQSQAQGLQAEKEAVAAQLAEAQAKIAELQGQVGGLKEQYELVGATPAETAEKIVRYYHDTHVYSTYDLFVCSDMASEIWNMLKAQGINAIIAVGDTDTAIADIVLCNHAWVLAEVAPGEYLALETTGGFVVPKSQNALYYRGWYFRSPKELKTHNRLFDEYNIRVGIRNQIAAEDREVVDEHNKATNQQTADKLMAVHEKLIELIEQHEAELNNIHAEIEGLASVL
jgi:hypothetical protein